MKNTWLKKTFDWKKLSQLKGLKYLKYGIGAVLLLCVLIFLIYPDPFINAYIKDRVTKSFTEAHPEYSLQLGDVHYNVWRNRLRCDSIILNTSDSTLTCNIGSSTVIGINWIKMLFEREITPNILTNSVIGAQKIEITFHDSKNRLSLGMLYLSVPDSVLRVKNIKYYPSIDDEQLFAKSKFRQTRVRLDILQTKIMGLDCLALFEGNSYNAGSINIYDIFADILVNMDKPYDYDSANPQMPNEILTSMKEMVKIDSLKIINGQLKYCERFAPKAIPGEIIFKKVNVSVGGIDNHSTHSDTTIIKGEGLFMDSALMKLSMAIPLASTGFSLKYSGSLSRMDLTKLNDFVEASEHQRIKSGVIQSAMFNITVDSGYASGNLRVIYDDFSIALLNNDTGSESGIFNQILSFFGKVFIIRGSNIPDEEGLMKIGEIKYLRKPDNTFLQYLWFALRSGVADLAGFPPDDIPNR